MNQTGCVPHWIETVETYNDRRSAGHTQTAADMPDMTNNSMPTDGQRRMKKPRRFGVYSVKEVLELKLLFDSMDTDGNGSINLQEFLTSPKWQSNHLSATAGSVFNTVDTDGDGNITLKELLRVAFPSASKEHRRDMSEFLQDASDPKPVKKARERKLGAKEIKEIAQMFNVFDLDHNGKVSLKEILQNTGGDASMLGENDLKMLADKFDTDGDQLLDVQEFQELMKGQYLNRKEKYF